MFLYKASIVALYSFTITGVRSIIHMFVLLRQILGHIHKTQIIIKLYITYVAVRKWSCMQNPWLLQSIFAPLFPSDLIVTRTIWIYLFRRTLHIYKCTVYVFIFMYVVCPRSYLRILLAPLLAVWCYIVTVFCILTPDIKTDFDAEWTKEYYR
jgi:hypothetical protein